jgi:hypothetical protein
MKRTRVYSTELARLFVWFAARIVPSGTRRDWTAEWNAELCHVCQSHAYDPVQFSLGAFQDAFWLRSDSLRFCASTIFSSGSASRCLLSLVVLAIGGILMCISLPGARRAISAAPYRNPSDLVIISSDGYKGTLTPTISLSDYREWKTDTRHLFSQIAYYQPVIGDVRLDSGGEVTLSIALASENLLHVLDFSSKDGRQLIAGERQLILSQSAWARRFSSNPYLVGKRVLIAGQPAVVAGVLPDRQWRLPGGMDALLIENTHSLAMQPETSKGFVIARLRKPILLANRHGWRLMSEVRDGVDRSFVCIPFAYLFGQPISVFLFGLLMAFISLPATIPLRLGDYPERHRHLPEKLSDRRWAFLLSKFLLLLLVVGSWSIVVAYGFATVDSSAPLYIQIGTSFPSLLIALRWMLHDQRRRCPVCLRVLSNPARVGQPSCNFLAWCGTELVCLSGHGLLHIPELPTSWFGTQRWLRLDASWASLFPGGL